MQTIDSLNPADLSDVVTTVALATSADVVAAAAAANEAQRAWADVPAPARGRTIAQVGRLVEANKEALAALVTREVGKPYAESLGEVQEVIDTCDFFLGEGRRLYGQTVPSEMSAKQLFTYRQPVGAASIITAANFPTAVPSLVPRAGAAVRQRGGVEAVGDGAGGGGSADRAVPCRRRARRRAADRGGDGPTAYDGLEAALTRGLVDKVGFTGSTEIGRRIGELAGRHLQSACLELGGKNPMVVMPDADLDLAVEGALFGGFGTAGQRCTSLGTLWAHEDVHDELLTRYVAAVSAAVIGDPTQDVLYGPMISPAYLDRHEKNLSLLASHHTVHGSTGTGRITSGNPRTGFLGDPDAGVFAHPTIVEGIRAGRRAVRHRDLRTARRVRPLRHPRRGHRAGQRARVRAVGLDLHDVAGVGVAVPRTYRCRDDVGEQLHLGRRGAPAVRRQRPLRERLAAERGVGARRVHPVAVGELGLVRAPAEGPDGRRRPAVRRRLPTLTNCGY